MTRTQQLVGLLLLVAFSVPLYLAAYKGRQEIDALQSVVAEKGNPDYVRVGNRIWVRPMEDDAAEWAARVRRILRGEEPLEDHYLCTILSGCSVPEIQIEVCTYCNTDPPSAACEARHAASVAAFCEEFECSDCGND